MSLILDGCWEQELSSRILGQLKPGDVFVDVGANMGYFTLLAARAVGPEGLVVAFEPNLSNLRYLLVNLNDNGCSNVLVHSLALSDRAEITKIWSAPYYNSGVSSLRGPEFAQSSTDFKCIGTARLDDLQALCQLRTRLSVIKIDTEGLEPAVLRGAIETLQANPRLSITCELSPQWYASEELIGILESLGFTGEYYCEGAWRSLNAKSPPTIQCNTWFHRE